MNAASGNSISKTDLAVFVTVLVVGVLAYFLLFNGFSHKERDTAAQQVQNAAQPEQPTVQEPAFPASFDWKTNWEGVQPILTSIEGDNTFTQPGTDLQDLSVVVDEENLYMRLATYDPIDINGTVSYDFYLHTGIETYNLKVRSVITQLYLYGQTNTSELPVDGIEMAWNKADNSLAVKIPLGKISGWDRAIGTVSAGVGVWGEHYPDKSQFTYAHV